MIFRDALWAADGGMIGMIENGIHVAFIVYGKDEAKRVLETHMTEASDPDPIEELRESALPDIAAKETVRLDGQPALTLFEMISDLEPRTTGKGSGSLRFASQPATVYSMFLTHDPTVAEAVIGYCDDKSEHSIVVTFSKEQIRRLANMQWVTREMREHILSNIGISGLPETTPRTPVVIGGQLAGLINTSYVKRQAKKLAARKLN